MRGSYSKPNTHRVKDVSHPAAGLPLGSGQLNSFRAIATRCAAAVCSALVLIMLAAAGMHARAATTTTIVPNGMTVPLNGFIANGSLTSSATGLPVRHLWISDHLQGTCRIDPDLDAAGPFALNPNTCSLGGPPVYDPQTNNVYIADDVANKTNQGVVRVRFLPTGDGGHGAISTTQATSLGGTGSCGVGSNRPTAMAQGPDGNLYIVFQRNGNIIRIVNPAAASVPCGNFQTIGQGADARRNFALAWVGHDLYGIDGGTPWQIPDADKCFTPANGNQTCRGETVLVDAAIIPGGLGSDQQYPSTNGTTLYVADITSVTKVLITPAGPELTLNWATGMSNPSSITADTRNSSNPVVYVGDDPTGGNGQLQGRIFQVSEAVAPAAPGTPTTVNATAGDGQATVNWTPGANGSAPTSRYTVHTFMAADNSPVPPDVDVTVVPPAVTPATSTIIDGLLNGVAYYFTVDATNSVGSSPPSARSNTVTPQAAVVPSAPRNVSAIPGNASAALAWSAPASNGGSPITGYTISIVNADLTLTQVATTPGTVTGTTINNLINGQPYIFSVRATNAAGDSPESDPPSNPVTPNGPAPTLDMALTMSGPSSVLVGANVAYTLTVTNVGGISVPQVVLTDTLPSAANAAFGSITTSRGVCVTPPVNGVITCNLGAMAANATATLTVSLNTVTATITNTATVQANDANGQQQSEANLTNNTASVTTTVTTPPPPQTTTDVQVTGAASNGGPNINTAITYTWQMKNSGKDVANNVVFTDALPQSLRFNSATANLSGTCSSTTTPGSAGGTVTCRLSVLNAGQTLIVTIGATPTVLGSISNTGAATFDGTDTNPANNSRTVTINVR